MSRRGRKFDPNADYLQHATGFERAQLETMAKIIEVKCEELRELRYQRDLLASRLSARKYKRDIRGDK